MSGGKGFLKSTDNIVHPNNTDPSGGVGVDCPGEDAS